MKINADWSERAVVRTDQMDWVASPTPGVERKMLERDGDEVARATSLVRYAPGSVFPPHEHGAGEEFLVLHGVFSDDMGDYGPGAYVRNPPGSSHTPGSRDGCTILVKLRYMGADDVDRVVVDTANGPWQPTGADGVEVVMLHDGPRETVALVRLAPGTVSPQHDHPGGEEVFVLEGALQDGLGHYPAGTWLRQPPGSSHQPSSPSGALLFVKSGHLRPAA